MAATGPVKLIQDFLGSAHLFSSAVTEVLQEKLQTLSGDHITFSQLKLLKLVALTDYHTLSEVAAFLGVSNAAVSKAVDRLVRRGLLSRATSYGDRRAVRLALTDEGESLLEKYEQATADTLDQVFGQFEPEKLRSATELLDRLSVHLVGQQSSEDKPCLRCGIYFRNRCLLQEAGVGRCYFQRHGKR